MTALDEIVTELYVTGFVCRRLILVLLADIYVHNVTQNNLKCL